MPERSRIPGDGRLDSTLSLVRDPYRFISRRCRELDTDLFQTRLQLHRTICMRGRDAAELFYDPGRFQRKGAAPERINKTLFGRGGVQGLDGSEHRHRKALFLGLMDADAIRTLAAITREHWRRAAADWPARGPIVLYDELQPILCRSACAWAGVPLPEQEVARRTRMLTPLFDQAGNIGPRHWLARLARKRANHWLQEVVEEVRAGRLRPRPEQAAAVMAAADDLDGHPLDARSAAVELNNVVRPIMAVSVFITHAALALHRFPEHARALRDGDAEAARRFAEEVRGTTPFFPMVGARVRESFTWRGYRFPERRRVLLDLYGTDQDARLWAEPQAFRPERFAGPAPDPYAFIPQGGGTADINHRCPGEGIAVGLIVMALQMLTGDLAYSVPEQDLSVDMGRLPALPKSGFVMRVHAVKPVADAAHRASAHAGIDAGFQ